MVAPTSPLIDGQNDLPSLIEESFHGQLSALELRANIALYPPPERVVYPDGAPSLMTDILRLRKGGVGGQFWSVWVSPSLHDARTMRLAIEQMDLVRQMTLRYPRALPDSVCFT